MRTPNHALPSLAIIAAILGLIVLVFAWVGGWLSPGRISGSAVVNGLQAANSKLYTGFRRAHAKGVCVRAILRRTAMARRFLARHYSQ